VKHNNSLSNLEWVTHAENIRRRDLNHPPAEITKGCISKNRNRWQWQYSMKGKRKSKYMKSRKDLLKFRKEKLSLYQ